jgi:hypothetical protein
MRELRETELTVVSGAGGDCYAPSKGNNGWGNGGDDGINSPKVDGGFKVEGDSDGFADTTGGGNPKKAR